MSSQCTEAAINWAWQPGSKDDDIAETAAVAPASELKKISACTITEPAVSVRRTALVLTSAAVARTVLMAVCAAAS